MHKTDLIYHSSYEKIEFPSIKKTRFTKDFSWGFYCTYIKEQAELSANNFIIPIVNIYNLKNTDLLTIKEFKDYCDEWLDFVMKCRNGNTHNYDIVIGPKADDTIYDYTDAYKDGQMNKELFYKLMKSKYLNNQISFHTIKALDCLHFIKSYTL